MKEIDIGSCGVQELNIKEAIDANGGVSSNPWYDLLWMCAETILDVYVSCCDAIVEGYKDGTITNVGSKR